MNFIAVIILSALIADFLLNLSADSLNLTRLSERLPRQFKTVYDPDQYRKSQRYTRINTRFGWVASGVQLVLVLGLWFGKGFIVLDEWARGLNAGPVYTGLLFIGALGLGKMLLNLPFDMYRTFVIEENFGFNKTDWQTFLFDRIKGLGLILVLGTPLLAGVLAFLEYAGNSAWLFCWATVVLFMLVLQFITPTWIMPLFNKFTPITPGPLKTAILAYAERIGFALENIFVMDGSKRSAKSNAFFAGFGKHRRIVLFDTLIRKLSISEMVAVLAHEMGHFKKHHILITMFIGVLHTGLMFYLLSFFISNAALFRAFYMDSPSVYAGLVFFTLLYAPLELFLGMLMQALSRFNEFQADRFSAQTTRNPGALISALKTLSVENLANLTPHPFYVFLNYSHPPVIDRISALESFTDSAP